MNAAAIQEIANIIVREAFNQVAKDAGLSVDNIKSLMHTDQSVMNRIADYIKAGMAAAEDPRFYDLLRAKADAR